MKRLIAVLLTVLMVASVCSVFSFADEPAAADVNLIAGLNGVGVAGNVDGKVVVGYKDATHDYTALLTDGKAAEKLTFDNNWFAFYRNVDANGAELSSTNAPGKLGTLVYDLGETCTINKARVHVAICNIYGVQAPKKITVSVSEDNKNYEVFATKSYTIPAENATDTAWDEFTGTARVGRYVKVEVELNGIFAFLNEIEVLGTKGDTAPEPVAHEITLDGKFDEALWANASTVDTVIWQGAKPNESWPKTAASYKVLADDENIYVALTVADKWNYKDTEYQKGATNFRIWMLGDADYATENKRTFFDVTLKEDGTLALWYNTAADIRKQDGTGKIEAKAVSTATTENIAVEFKIKKSAINATNGFKMMVTYSSPAIVEGDKAPVYNALHITPKNDYVKDDKGEYVLDQNSGAYKLPEGWSASAVMYQEFVYADGVVTKPGEGGDTSSDTSSEASTGDTSSTGTDTPVTGDAGVIVLVVMAVVAAFGSAVVVKSRR